MPVCERCDKSTPSWRPNRFSCYNCGRKLCFQCCGKDFDVYWCDAYNGKIADDCREHRIKTSYVNPKDKR
jgi:hypothetical protein